MTSGEAPDARHKIETREKFSKTYQKMWMKAQKVAKKHYDKRRKAQSFEKKQKILLSAKYIRVRKPYRKLTDRFLKPFKITKRVGENTYQLDLPKQYKRLHNTFHISLLEPYVKRESKKPPGPVNIEKDRFLIKSVLNERLKQRRSKFLIKWVNYPEHEST